MAHKGSNIFLVYADYRNHSTAPPYPVRGENKKEIKEYFRNKYSWLKIIKIEEYGGDTSKIQYFW